MFGFKQSRLILLLNNIHFLSFMARHHKLDRAESGDK